MTEAATPSATSQPAETPPPSSAGSIKETIESILVAFVLAFVFRAFVVEAFVIPTGSMAPTLLGAHMRFVCEDCGYRFDVNFGTGQNGDDIRIPPSATPLDQTGKRFIDPRTGRPAERVYSAYCPNCGFHLSRSQTSSPPVHYGDRILVLKYAYLINDPQRWDVVVFKSPATPGYQTNYIKRLVGKPGEQVMILDGDIYARSSSTEPWTVQTKPRHVQNALWRIVHDNDYYPRGLQREGERWRQPWTVRDGGGWDLGDSMQTGRTFTFDNANGSGTLAFDPEANPTTSSFTDWLAYDVTSNQDFGGGRLDTYNAPIVGRDNTVSDLKLAFFYKRESGDGALSLSLTKLDHTFTAELTPGAAVLYRTRSDGEREKIGEAALPTGSRPLQVEFSNVDYRVTLCVNGSPLLQTTPEQYSPNLESLLDAYRRRANMPRPKAEIRAENQKATFSHISLWRDVYYINSRSHEASLRHGMPDNPIQLGPDEFFVLGDNSFMSLDGRFWNDPIDLPYENLHVQAGRVPARFMLGKAFFVYWPSGYRPSEQWPAIIPNFGDMRFIQ